jgi:hypothetical protein
MLRLMVLTGDTYDVFLSHASEDKADVVIPVLALLRLVDSQAHAAVQAHGFWDGIADEEVRVAIAGADDRSL